MTHSKSKLTTKDIKSFREFLEARGFKCRDGKGEWQSLQVQNITDRGWKAFCHNAKGIVTSPVEFDALIQVFRAPVDPVLPSNGVFFAKTPADKKPGQMVYEKDLSAASHDSDLLDDFAIAALQGILANKEEMELVQKASFIGSLDPDEVLASRSYSVGLAMMAERAKHQPK